MLLQEAQNWQKASIAMEQSLEPGKFKKAVFVWGKQKFIAVGAEVYMLCLHSSVNNKEV